MKTIKDLPEELQREFETLVAEKNNALLQMELEGLKSTARKCVKARQFDLYSIIIGVTPESVNTAQAQLRTWREKTANMLSENIHPTEGRRLLEILALSRISGDPVANLRAEATMYSNFLKTLEKRLIVGCADLNELLRDRIHLGHVIQRTIPRLNSKFLRLSDDSLVSLLKSINADLKSNKLGYKDSPAVALTPETSTLGVFSSWLEEADGIIDNLNVALTDLFSLRNQTTFFGQDLWIRYRYFIRMYIYEYSRFRPAFRRFLKKLWRLAHIDQATRQGVAECWELLNYQMIRVRNQIYHALMPIIDEEESAFLVTTLAPAINRFVMSQDTSKLIQPSDEVALLADKMATEIGECGRNAVAFLQVLTEERYQDIKERFPGWDSFKN